MPSPAIEHLEAEVAKFLIESRQRGNEERQAFRQIQGDLGVIRSSNKSIRTVAKALITAFVLGMLAILYANYVFLSALMRR